MQRRLFQIIKYVQAQKIETNMFGYGVLEKKADLEPAEKMMRSNLTI